MSETTKVSTSALAKKHNLPKRELDDILIEQAVLKMHWMRSEYDFFYSIRTELFS